MVSAWWSLAVARDLPSIILPTPPDVLDALARSPIYLLGQARITFLETIVGFGITTVGGLAIGVVIAHSVTADKMFSPWLVAFNAVPKVALAPLLVVWFGFGMESRVAMVILMCFFPIVLATIAGLTQTPAEMIELTRSLDASRFQTFVKVRLPYALPQIFVGLKVAMPLAIIGAVIGEFRGNGGLGQVIVRAGGTGDTALAFAAIVVLSAMSVVMFYLMVWAERAMVPWVRSTTS
jgi:NitT/TauT family transport system permease protein